MNDLHTVFGFGLTTGAALAFGYVLVANWRAVLAALGRDRAPRPGGASEEPKRSPRRSLIFLAGPVLLVALVQGLRMVAPLSGTAVLIILLVGLLVDPAALPVLVFLVYRRSRGGEAGRPR